MAVQCANSSNSYIIEDSEAELARLIRQEDLFSGYEAGLFPEGTEHLAGVRRILDLACGPGGWALQMATAHPDIEVIGVDLSERMIGYARSRARARGIRNARFSIMDITRPLELPDSSCGLVNARFLQSVLTPCTWPPLISECFRILRPGGTVRLTEGECGASNMPATSRLLQLLPEVLYRTGRSFSPDGSSLGITCMLGHFLRVGDYTGVRNRAFAVDYSVGTAAHEAFTQHLRITFSQFLLGNYILSDSFMDRETYEDLYERALREMSSDQFCGIGFFLTALGEKPLL